MKNPDISKRPISISKSPHIKEDGLSEIYQSMDTQMALLTRQGPGEFTQITPLVKCRDFLVDVYSYSKAKKKFGIYGMQFDPSLETPQLDGVSLLFQFPDNKAQQSFEKNLSHLHMIEGVNNFVLTEYVPLEDRPKYAVILADKGWLMNCLTFSLFTSLLRVFCYPLEEDGWIPQMRKRYEKNHGETDAMLVNSVCDETWLRVLENLKSIKTENFCGFDPLKDTKGTIHHNSGFYSVFGTHRELSIQTVKTNAHWKQFSEAGWQLHTK